MSEPKPKNAPAWLYAVAIAMILFVLGTAFLFRFAPQVIVFW